MTLKTINKLGTGGFGNVDLVKDENDDEYARKTFSVNQPLTKDLVENVKKRFIREAKIQESLSHPNIVPVLGGDLDADPPFYLMPVANGNLADDLAKDKKLGGQFLSAISDIVAALDEMHAVGIFHRDLKPQNVLRFGENEDAQYAISDFGLISQKDSTVSKLTQTGMMKGSDYFTAPEITADLRKASAQSDIFSLGCILHEMVGTSDRVPCQEIREDGDYSAILLNCTRNDPKRRFKSVRAVLDAIVSVDPTAPPVTDKGAERIISSLEADEACPLAFWKDLASFLEDNKDANVTRALLTRLSSERIAEACTTAPDEAKRLAIVYAQWVKNSAFNFEACDGIANRLEIFIAHCDISAIAECLLALLELGVSHNRWYVERKFVSLCGPEMNENWSKRLAIEFRADAQKICDLIDRMERSISVKRSALHPLLVKTLGSICE